jgi:hypothetical protein
MRLAYSANIAQCSTEAVLIRVGHLMEQRQDHTLVLRFLTLDRSHTGCVRVITCAVVVGGQFRRSRSVKAGARWAHNTARRVETRASSIPCIALNLSHAGWRPYAKACQLLPACAGSWANARRGMSSKSSRYGSTRGVEPQCQAAAGVERAHAACRSVMR